MNFKSKWYSAENKPLDIPTFMDLQNVTGQVFDDFGNYIGQKELPKQQLILDQQTQRQYYAPIEYDDDAIRYARAKIDESFSPEEWYGMTRIKPHYTLGEHISAGYITTLKSFAKPVAMLPTQLVYAGTVGLNYISQGNFESAENLYRFSMKNWEDTLDKYGLGNDPELRDMFTAKAGSVVGQVASSLLVASVVSSVGGLPAVAAVFGSTQFADIMEESLAKGLSHDKAVKVAFLAALSEGGLEAVGFRMWRNAASLNKSFRNLTLAFLWEGSQEGSQQIGESAITNFYGVREQKLSEIVSDVMLSFLIGGLVGFGGAAISGQAEQRNIALKKEVGMNEQGQIVTPKVAEQRKAELPKEGQVLNPSPEARKQLYAQEIEEAKKTGDNKLYNTIKYAANANGITDVNVIDKLYPVCSEMINDGAVLENLLDIIGQQVVAYKNQLESGQTDTKATQKAVEEIKLVTDPNRVDEWRESRKSELEKTGFTKEQAGILSTQLSQWKNNLSQRLGFDITEKKAVSFEPNLQAKAGTRGQITLGKTIAKIALNKNADPTTVEHEFFHYVDSVVKDAAQEGNKEAQKLLKKRDSIIKEAKAELKKNGITKFPSDEEIIASAYEKWLWNGAKSEDATEQQLFNAIREFFREVYDAVKGLMGIRITPEADAYFRAMTGETKRVLAQPMIPSIDVNQRANIVDLTSADVTNKKTLLSFIKSLIGTKEKTADGKVLNFIKTVRRNGKRNVNVPQHIVYSSFKQQNQSVRAKAIGNINELIRNSVLVEEEKAKSDKKDYDKLFRFYVPLRVGNNVYTARISALHNSKTQSFDMSSDLYDVILEMNQRTASAMISDTESGDADTISIAEMLQNVNGADGEFYIKPTIDTFEQSDTLFQEGIKYDKNGKADTNSPEFKKWSHGNPIVSAEESNSYNFQTGKSVVVEAFHGSPNENISYFDISRQGKHTHSLDTKGSFFFVNNEDSAFSYTQGINEEQEKISIEIDKANEKTQEIRRKIGKEFGQIKSLSDRQKLDEKVKKDPEYIKAWKYENELMAKAFELKIKNKGMVYNVYLSISNPLVVDLKGAHYDTIIWQRLINNAKNNGNDGIIIKNTTDIISDVYMHTGDTEYIVFNPTQIKSVYNRGTFDSESPNIYYQQETQDQLFRNDQATKHGNRVLDKAPTNQEVEDELEIIQSGRVEKAQEAKRGLGIIEGFGDALITVRQRVGVIDKRLKYAFDKLDYNEKMMESEYGKRTLPFIKKYRKLSDVDKKVLNYLIGNQQTERIRKFLRERDMEREYNDVRNLLDELFEEGNRAGMDMGFLQEYFPTKVSDYKSFISYLMGTDKWSEIELALNQIDHNHQMSEEERADAINSILRGYNRLDPVGKKGFQKERKILHKTPEMMNYYMPADEALMRYVSGMTNALAIRKAFNVKGAFNSEESIGGVVEELIRSGKITQKEEAFIKKMLKARLNYARTAPIISLLKNFGYLGTMNNITSAVTQIGDLYATFYKYNFPTAVKAIFGKSDITKDDLYLDSIWEEFSNDGFTSVAVNKLFKAIGLNAFDAFGKNTAINGAWIDLKERAKNNDVSLLEDLTAAFGSQAGKVLENIKNNNITSEVKLMLWSQLADTQPIGKSGTPVGYLSNGYARILYQLKTYTVNQLSLFYADGLYKIQKGIATKNKKLFLQGTGNLMKLALLLTVFNAGADVLKNLIMGRSIEISDTLVSNLIWNLGVSKYTFYRGQRDGYARALFENFFPPQISMLDEAYKDAKKIATGKKEASDTIAVTYVPFGRMWYWWFGGGRASEKKKGNKPFQVKL